MKLRLPGVVELHADERAPLSAAFCGFFCLLCGYYLLRPLRDALGLAGGVGQLPWLFTATFLAMLALVPVMGWLVRRLPPARFVPVVFRFFALNILLFALWFASAWAPLAAARVFFVWLSVYNLFVVSMFWSALADRFTPGQGKRLFAFITAGGSAGALAGPALTALLVNSLGPAGLALLGALLLEATVQCWRVLIGATRQHGGAAADAKAQSGLGGHVLNGLLLLVRDAYLAGIAVYFLLHTLASTFLYLEQARLIAAASLDTATRAQWFALVDLAVSCSSLLLQIFVSSALMRRFGLAPSLAVLPVLGWLALLACALLPSLGTLAVAQALRRSGDYALSRPAREVLFTVVSREAKYKAKGAMETVVYRAGDAASSWLFSALTAMGAGFLTLAWLMLPVSLAWTWLCAWLARRQAAVL